MDYAIVGCDFAARHSEVGVYCNGCERGVALGGKRPVQVLELLFSAWANQ